jgi:hypothetical protein
VRGYRVNIGIEAMEAVQYRPNNPNDLELEWCMMFVERCRQQCFSLKHTHTHTHTHTLSHTHHTNTRALYVVTCPNASDSVNIVFGMGHCGHLSQFPDRQVPSTPSLQAKYLPIDRM